MSIYFYISISIAVLSLAGIVFSTVNLFRYRRAVKNIDKSETVRNPVAHEGRDKASTKQKPARKINRLILTGNQGIIYDGELIGALSIGRSIKNDVVINDPKVSGQHCRLSGAGGAFYVEDLSSTNGTYVNDNRIHARTQLKSGDTLRLGVFQMTVTG